MSNNHYLIIHTSILVRPDNDVCIIRSDPSIVYKAHRSALQIVPVISTTRASRDTRSCNFFIEYPVKGNAIMRLNSIIPNFKAETTQGPIDFYEWQGNSWVVIFSHPADFTPVCTTELGRIAVHQPYFEKRNTKLLAHSVDKLKDHVDWVNDIKSYCKDIPGAFPYPIIADHKRKLAVQLDMIDEQSKDDPQTAETVRALYIVSPDHRLRLSMQYPTSTGRNVDEILRVIDSLQLVDRRPEVATPANWVPGEKVMILPSVKDEDLPNLFPGGVDRVSMPSGKVYVRTTTDY